ncbi:MAG: protein phosphatase CheZ [Deltaproteobacteria bacterium]|nr:protein phosphatase CheZ [Deltaproteobacteria bacterium]
MADNDWNDALTRVKTELSVLVKFVDKTRNGLDSLQSTVKISSEKFPEASRQITSVAGEIESAANNIITLLESMMLEQEKAQYLIKSLSTWIKGVPLDDKPKVTEALSQLDGINTRQKRDLMEIFTNLSFQDLTGQKLKKVIASLSIIESKLLELALTFDFGDSIRKEDKKEMLNELKETHAAEPMRLNQDVVDKILKELGA